MFNAHSAFKPRNGIMLRVLIIARISTLHQDPRSLADQIAFCEKYVRDRYDCPIEFIHIQSRGSGEVLDRKELAEAEAAVESGTFDLVFVEDIGRVCRRHRAVDFCELCEDADTRLIAINDGIDTANETWRMNAFFASLKHETSNKDTSNRIRRSLRNRFGNGEVIQTFPFGYIKPPGARKDSEVKKDPAAEAIYDEWFRRLEQEQSYSEVADWLNSQGVPTGQWARGPRWTGRMVARVTHNPILKGYRRRNERMSRRVNKSGRRKSIKAPPDKLLLRHAPNLQFIEPDRYDRLMYDLQQRHEQCARGRVAGTPDGRTGVPKKKTVWPGQRVVCGVCGRTFYWGGHGQADRMMCSGAREYHCWNSATFDGREAGRRIAHAVLTVAERLVEFDAAFRAKVEQEAVALNGGRVRELQRLANEIGKASRELANLTDSLARIGFSEALGRKLAETEGRLARLKFDRQGVLQQPDEPFTIPPISELRDRARQVIAQLAFDNADFGRQMSLLAPNLAVFPYRLLDGGAVVLRVQATINLAPLAPPSAVLALSDMLARTITIDLFDPPQRVAFRERVVQLRRAGRTERDVAAELGLTVTATQRAMSLHRMMEAAGATDPYQILDGPPEGDVKFKRHLHSRYRFSP